MLVAGDDPANGRHLRPGTDQSPELAPGVTEERLAHPVRGQEAGPQLDQFPAESGFRGVVV